MVAPLTSEDPRDPFTLQAPALSWDTSPPFQATWGAWKLRPLSSPLWRACEPVFSMCHSHCHSTAQAPCWTWYQAKSGTSLQGYQFSGLCSQKQRERPAIQECFCYSFLSSLHFFKYSLHEVEMQSHLCLFITLSPLPLVGGGGTGRALYSPLPLPVYKGLSLCHILHVRYTIAFISLSYPACSL